MKSLFFQAVAVLMFLLCSQVIYGLFHQGDTEMSLDASTDPSLASSLISAVICAAALLLLLFHMRALPAMLAKAKLVMCLPVLAILSAAWSQDPSLTLRRGMVLLLVSVIGACFGAIYTLRQICQMLTVTTFVICTLTFAVSVISPGVVHDSLVVGAWRGLFSHKNAQGMMMGLGLVSAIHARFDRLRWFKYLTMAMAAVLLVLSHSSTSLVAVIVSLAVLPFWGLTRVPLKHALLTVAVTAMLLGVIGFLVTHFSAEIFHALGKSPTLTGRTQLWALILQSISRRPLLGYGYNAFWLGLRGESLSIIAASGWVVYHAHNGLLDIFLGLGTVGAVLFLMTYVRLFSSILGYIRSQGLELQNVWPGSFLVLLTVINCTESVLLSANTIFWLLYVVVYANVARSAAFRSSERGSATRVADEANWLATTAF